MNIDSILSFEAESVEDYYEILGCDPSSSEEQIMSEFKIRAKEFHPGKINNFLMAMCLLDLKGLQASLKVSLHGRCMSLEFQTKKI